MSTTTSVCPCSTPTITGPTRASSIYGDVNQHTTPSDRLVRTNPNPTPNPHSSPCPGAGSCSASCRAWRRRRWRRRWSLPSSSTTASSATTSGKAGAAGAEEAEAPHPAPHPPASQRPLWSSDVVAAVAGVSAGGRDAESGTGGGGGGEAAGYVYKNGGLCLGVRGYCSQRIRV